MKWTNINKTTAEKSLPRYIAELAEIMESDPDPQFEGVGTEFVRILV